MCIRRQACNERSRVSHASIINRMIAKKKVDKNNVDNDDIIATQKKMQESER